MKIPSQYFGHLRHGLHADRPVCPSLCRSRGHHPDGLALHAAYEDRRTTCTWSEPVTMLYIPLRRPGPTCPQGIDSCSDHYESHHRNTVTGSTAHRQMPLHKAGFRWVRDPWSRHALTPSHPHRSPRCTWCSPQQWGIHSGLRHTSATPAPAVCPGWCCESRAFPGQSAQTLA